MPAWIAAGYRIAALKQESPAELLDMLSTDPRLQVVDVRTDDEWRRGHICGATHLMGGDVPERAPELARAGARLALVCQTGYRSTVAASVLARAGLQDVRSLTGGMNAWQQAGLPVCTE
jgi:hydroxyacylglutathione hydrolase